MLSGADFFYLFSDSRVALFQFINTESVDGCARPGFDLIVEKNRKAK